MSGRRLTALLMADVVGYSTLISADEAGTVARVQALRGEVLEPALTANDGRLVKAMGDGFLAEFGSIVDAVSCAVAVQEGMAGESAGEADGGRIRLRIGVHVGGSAGRPRGPHIQRSFDLSSGLQFAKYAWSRSNSSM